MSVQRVKGEGEGGQKSKLSMTSCWILDPDAPARRMVARSGPLWPWHRVIVAR
jgi:hypothetical protein